MKIFDRMKYSEIKDIKSLDKAREDIFSRLESKENEIMRNYGNVKEAYSPVSIFAGALRSISHDIPFDRIALGMVRSLINRLR